MISHMEEVPRWLTYSLISSLLCVCGGLCVPLISFTFKSRKHINSKLVNYGLSLSAGSMLTTALYKMLPSSNPKEANQMTVFAGVLIGMCLSLFLNYLVHARASQSLVHCAHDAEPQSEHHHNHDHVVLDYDHSVNEADAVPADPGQIADQVLSQPVVGEQTALLKGSESIKGKSREQPLKGKHSLIDILSTVDATKMGDCFDSTACVPMTKGESFACVPPSLRLRPSMTSILKTNASNQENDELATQQVSADPIGVTCLENELGYDLENLSVYRKNFHSQSRTSHSHHHDHRRSSSSSSQDYGSVHLAGANTSVTNSRHNHHHHHFETPFSKLVSIGMQTCVVITLHKFPEGFIIFYTNQSSDVSKELGFSIFLSLCIHNFVEGFSMTLPFYAAFESKALALLITTILGGCSQPLGALIGYLLFKNKEADRGQPHMDMYLSVTAGFLLVIGLQMFQTGIGFSQGHHHHEGEPDDEIKKNHTSVNTCLRWCCVGVLLILASGVFR